VTPAVREEPAHRRTGGATRWWTPLAVAVIGMVGAGVAAATGGFSGSDAARLVAYSSVAAALAGVVAGVVLYALRRATFGVQAAVAALAAMLAVAIGGVFVELLGDSVLAPLPVSTARAAEMLRGMRASALLDGVRGGQPVDVDAVASVIMRIGDLAVALGGELDSLEVNPLWVDGGTTEALDAVVTWCSK